MGWERVGLCLGDIICVNWGISGLVKASLKLSGSGPPSTLNLQGEFRVSVLGSGVGDARLRGSGVSEFRAGRKSHDVFRTRTLQVPSNSPKLSIFSVYNRG